MRPMLVGLGLLAATGIAGVAMAGPDGERGLVSARQAVVERFEAAAPAVGKPLPDVELVDPEGRVHNLRELAREHYTVLVLGCLT